MLVNIPSPTEFIDQEVPSLVRQQLSLAVGKAYSLVYQIGDVVEILQWPVGKDLDGYLRRIAVEWEIKRLCDAGQIPIDYRIAKNVGNNCHHVELYTNQSVITISQVPSLRAIPQRSIFRENLSMSNQLRLNLTFPDGNPVYRSKGSTIYLLLTHGYSGERPDFVTLGIPEPEMNGWITQINILKEPQHALLQPEVVDEEILVRFKQHLKEVKEYGA